ncbi:porin [Solemya velum gill symbiont]|uniref:porin n=1 Tax=Solemya velum gill symbiont TaxID=2340 RepID=UPI000998886A|nr:porin [Solemya velum gill symbiont]OOY46062.1 hypothetical protein BOV93_11435 [Solemya velum gill symbiont]
MKKSILAAAIAAAVAAPAVNANVTIYGKVHVSVDNIDGDMYNWPDEDGYRHDDSISDLDQWQVKSRASRIGFNGTEDLGNGLSLIWKAETTYDFADGSAWGSGRNAYIGLTGDWGTFLYGRHDTPYKMAYYAGGVEMMGDTIIDFGETGYLDSTYSRVRASNAIAYVSPNMNGLTIAAAIVPGEGNNFDKGTGLADNKFLVTAGYTMNNFTIAALYQNADFEDQDIDTVLLAGSYSMGNNTFVAKWGRTKDSYRDGTRATVWSLGAEHKLSKRSSVYVGYTNADENYQDDSMDGFSVGMIHNF